MISRRISSMDGLDELTAGSCNPNTSQWIFALRVPRFGLCEPFVPHEVYMTVLPFKKCRPQTCRTEQPFTSSCVEMSDSQDRSPRIDPLQIRIAADR